MAYTNLQLRPLGFVPGRAPSWCAACNREIRGAADGFKCRGCAEKQLAEVDTLCVEAGMEEPT